MTLLVGRKIMLQKYMYIYFCCTLFYYNYNSSGKTIN